MAFAIPDTARAQGTISSGENQSGLITAPGETHEWTFEAGKDDAIAVSIGEVMDGEVDTGFVPWIRLTGPDGADVGSDSGNLAAQVQAKAPLTGTYTVAVASNDSGRDGTGRYVLYLALAPAAFVVPDGDQGGALTNGGNHAGRVDVGDLDIWSVEASKDDFLILSVGEVEEGEVDPGFVPWIRLYGPDGATVASDSGDLAAQVQTKLPLSGTYTVVLGSNDSGRDAAGSYLLHMALAPATFIVPDGDQGGDLTNGGNHGGTLSVGDLDLWSLEVGKDERVIVSVGEVLEGEVDPGFVPWVRVYGPDGAESGADWGNLAAQVNFGAPLTGTYTVVIGSNDSGRDAIGSYVLHLALAPATFVVPESDQGGDLTNGGNHEGALSVGDLDLWSFEMGEEDRVLVSVGEVLEGEVDPGFVPWVRVYGPDGAESGSDWGNLAAQVDFEAPLTGTYTVVVGSNDSGRDAIGSYLLHLAVAPGTFVVPEGDQGGDLTNGGNHEGAIHVGDLDLWTFEASQNDPIVVSAGEVLPGEVDPGFVPWIRLYGPDGARVASEWGNQAAQLSANAPLSGTYMVVVSSNDSGRDATGNYLLHLALMPERFLVPEGDEGGPMAENESQLGSIHVGDLDLWLFEGDDGNEVTLRLTKLTGDGFIPWLRVYDVHGERLNSRWNNSEAEITEVLAASGLYAVLVASNDSGNDATGTYQLSATGLPEQGKQLRFLGSDQNTLILNWPSALGGYVLQENERLRSEGWVDVETVPEDNGFNTRLTIPIGDGNRFFRLRPPQE